MVRCWWVALVAALCGCHRATPAEGPVGVPQEAQSARVVRHVDGDTLHLTSSHLAATTGKADTTVRLLEIDTPESRPSEECYSTQATRALARLAPVGATVWFTSDTELLDRYGRTLLYVWNDDGVFVNLSLVQHGAARAVLFEPNDRYISAMRRAETLARSAHRGLWAACARRGG